MSADTTPAAVAERVAAWREMARMTLALDDHPLNDLPRVTAAKLDRACDLIDALAADLAHVTAERDAMSRVLSATSGSLLEVFSRHYASAPVAPSTPIYRTFGCEVGNRAADILLSLGRLAIDERGQLRGRLAPTPPATVADEAPE